MKLNDNENSCLLKAAKILEKVKEDMGGIYTQRQAVMTINLARTISILETLDIEDRIISVDKF